MVYLYIVSISTYLLLLPIYDHNFFLILNKEKRFPASFSKQNMLFLCNYILNLSLAHGHACFCQFNLIINSLHIFIYGYESKTVSILHANFSDSRQKFTFIR